MVETSSCDGLRIKERVDFEVELTLTKCPADDTKLKPLIINAQGIGERVVINIDPLCECDCEKKTNDEMKSTETQQTETSLYCNQRGRIVCGICECDPLYYGSKCECSKSELDTNKGSTGNISSCIK